MLGKVGAIKSAVGLIGDLGHYVSNGQETAVSV
jgi:hypothetical protein